MVLLKSSLEITLDGMAEKDRIRFFHHGSFKMERQEHASVFSISDFKVVEVAESFLAQVGRVNNFSLQKSGALLKDSSLSFAVNEFNADIGSVSHNNGLFVRVEISRGHVTDMGLTGARPGHHSVRVGSGPFLDGTGNTSVGVTFTEDGVDSRSKNLSVGRVDLLLSIIGRLRRVVGDSESFSLKFSNAELELGDRS